MRISRGDFKLSNPRLLGGDTQVCFGELLPCYHWRGIILNVRFKGKLPDPSLQIVNLASIPVLASPHPSVTVAMSAAPSGCSHIISTSVQILSAFATAPALIRWPDSTVNRYFLGYLNIGGT